MLTTELWLNLYRFGLILVKVGFGPKVGLWSWPLPQLGPVIQETEKILPNFTWDVEPVLPLHQCARACAAHRLHVV